MGPSERMSTIVSYLGRACEVEVETVGGLQYT